MGLTAVGSLVAGFAMRGVDGAEAAVLRPPGAIDEEAFAAACIRCFQCGSVCPNQCIQFRPLSDGPAQAFTPYIRPREQACILCMRCTEACPTDALTPIAGRSRAISRPRSAWESRWSMRIYATRMPVGPVASAFYACPFPGTALRLKTYAQPVIDRGFLRRLRKLRTGLHPFTAGGAGDRPSRR